MSEIPRRLTIKIIDETLEKNQEQEHRPHLGGSLIGHVCTRHIWYSFRWYKKEDFSGRMLRLFDRGHGEEDRFTEFLTACGFKVEHSKPNPQIRYFMLGGHFSCEIDGVISGLPECPSEKHVLEFKTYNENSFLKLLSLTKKDYKSLINKIPFQCDTKSQKPQHFYQMQTGMGMSQLEGEGYKKALYLAVNKNDDCLAQERLNYDDKIFNGIVEKADRIIFDKRIPPRVSDYPSNFDCKFCKFSDICHFGEKPEKNCRTCQHSEAVRSGGWLCKKHNSEIPEKKQGKEYYCYEEVVQCQVT